MLGKGQFGNQIKAAPVPVKICLRSLKSLSHYEIKCGHKTRTNNKYKFNCLVYRFFLRDPDIAKTPVNSKNCIFRVLLSSSQKHQDKKLFIYFGAFGPSLKMRSMILTACSKGA